MGEFIREALAEVPIAFGALVGFAVGAIAILIDIIRERRRKRRS